MEGSGRLFVRIVLMSDPATEASCAHAFLELLLDGRTLGPDVVVTGGGRLDAGNRARMVRHAITSAVDVLHLAFGSGRARPLDDVTLFLPRFGRCDVQGGCRLWMSACGGRATIVPPSDVGGSFRLTAHGIVRLADAPGGDRLEGLARARVWLADRVARAGSAFDDVTGRGVPEAA